MVQKLKFKPYNSDGPDTWPSSCQTCLKEDLCTSKLVSASNLALMHYTHGKDFIYFLQKDVNIE